MKRQNWAIVLALVIAAALQQGCASTESSPRAVDRRCEYDRSQLLGLDPERFDSTPQAGWRIIGDVPGCELAAADLIATYRTSKDTELSDRERRSLYWHEAQLRAGADDRGAAVRLMNQARRPEGDSSSVNLEDRLYIDASIAFLENDQQELRRIREEYAGIPAPEGFAEAAERFRASTGETLAWPPNLHVIDGFIACFGRPYRVAYSPECQRETAQ